LTGDKLNQFPQVKSVLPMMVTGESSLPVLILIHEPFVVFFLPCPADGEGVMEQLWWASGSQPG